MITFVFYFITKINNPYKYNIGIYYIYFVFYRKSISMSTQNNPTISSDLKVYKYTILFSKLHILIFFTYFCHF